MEKVISYVLKQFFDEYINGLDSVNASQFPVVLQDLTLKEKKIQEDMGENTSCPFTFIDGNIGSILLWPSIWQGKLEVTATNVKLNFGFSAMKALQNALPRELQPKPEGTSGGSRSGQPGPLFCENHNSHAKRREGALERKQCRGCKKVCMSTYVEISYCPQCSNKLSKCMCCGVDMDSCPNGNNPPSISSPNASDASHASASPRAAPSTAALSSTSNLPSCRPLDLGSPVVSRCEPAVSHQNSTEKPEDCTYLSGQKLRDSLGGPLHVPSRRPDQKESLGMNHLSVGDDEIPDPGTCDTPTSCEFPDGLLHLHRVRHTSWDGDDPLAFYWPRDADWVPEDDLQSRGVLCASHHTPTHLPEGQLQMRECKECRLHIRTSLQDFAVCASCSDQKSKCMICEDVVPDRLRIASGEIISM
eukprot:gnl/TRDRNA2_/TRDRNA2_90940_c0_seq1.p1 gnl/TRDRNA2_/TRDRNA2_90940_c0~~gnl/TRDRNA2_/TRDRNA2_90940_c0_seq1.p1  ORF type:complete len:417 (-),score=41.42 gnl/TRDRNA2_/TRDRNA2_90940_c0_seq1:41-1291(-)